MDGKKDFPPALSHTRFLEHYSTHSDAILVFTDGTDGVGFSVVFFSFYRSGSLPSVASVFTAELSAIVLALQICYHLGAFPLPAFLRLTPALV
ncbi:hypothetical protein E2C01_028919 [Portunus trituberculatus]|uniref:RNase H type-1 domain-containing protein n=1 Tax=Portunus trituberculatus TaxID=210409 RepID=A0A5B7EQ20_PORTR|nr:hypothetical protein [Portunus trituberculatus]